MQLLRRLVRYALLATAAQGCFLPIKRSDTVDGARTEYVPATSTCPSEDEAQRKWQTQVDDLSLDATRNLGGRSRVCWYRLSLRDAQAAEIADDCAGRSMAFASVRANYLATYATTGRVSPRAPSLTVPEPHYRACVEGGAVAAYVVAYDASCAPPATPLVAPRFVLTDTEVTVAAVVAVDELPDVLACEYSYEYEQSRGGCGSPRYGL